MNKGAAGDLADLLAKIEAFGGASLTDIRCAMRHILQSSESEAEDCSVRVSTAIFRACERESFDEAKIVLRSLVGTPRIMVADMTGKPSPSRYLAEIEGPQTGSGAWGRAYAESEALALIMAILQVKIRHIDPHHPRCYREAPEPPVWIVARRGEVWPCPSLTSLRAEDSEAAARSYCEIESCAIEDCVAVPVTLLVEQGCSDGMEPA